MVTLDTSALAGVGQVVAGMRAAGYTDEQVAAELTGLGVEFLRAQAPDARAAILGMLRGFLAAAETAGLA